jgi:hypothetical protein
VALATAGIVNPIKLGGVEGSAFVAVLDVLMASVSGILSFALAGLDQSATAAAFGNRANTGPTAGANP